MMVIRFPIIFVVAMTWCTIHRVSGLGVLVKVSCVGRTYGSHSSSLPLFSEAVNSSSSVSPRGDKLRDSTGIRPSLHPTTINALSETLRRRSLGGTSSKLVICDEVTPLDVAMETGRIVADFLLKRRNASKQDGMAFDLKEEQTIAGRVVGVLMRLDELGSLLQERVCRVNWVKKYNEWTSFGTLEDTSTIETHIATDPLFALCRSECLLALFLDTVEAPKLVEIGETVPDGSRIDFVDADRLEVLLGDFRSQPMDL